jgi:hypothetical protein
MMAVRTCTVFFMVEVICRIRRGMQHVRKIVRRLLGGVRLHQVGLQGKPQHKKNTEQLFHDE